MFIPIVDSMQLSELKLEQLQQGFTTIAKALFFFVSELIKPFVTTLSALLMTIALVVYLFKLLRRYADHDDHAYNEAAVSDAPANDASISTLEPAGSAVVTTTNCEDSEEVHLSIATMNLVKTKLAKHPSRKRKQRTSAKSAAVSFISSAKRDEKARAGRNQEVQEQWCQHPDLTTVTENATQEGVVASERPLTIEQEKPQAGIEVITASKGDGGVHDGLDQKLQFIASAESAPCENDEASQCAPEIEQQQAHPVGEVAAPLKKDACKKLVRFREELCTYAPTETASTLGRATSPAIAFSTLQIALETALPASPPASPPAHLTAPALVSSPAITHENLQAAQQAARPASPPASPPVAPKALALSKPFAPPNFSLKTGAQSFFPPTPPLTPLRVKPSGPLDVNGKRKRYFDDGVSDEPRKRECRDTTFVRGAQELLPTQIKHKNAALRELKATHAERELLAVSRKLEALHLAETAEDAQRIKDFGDVLAERMRRLSLEETDLPEDVLQGLRRLSLEEDVSEPMDWTVKPKLVKRRRSWPEYESTIREYDNCSMDLSMDLGECMDDSMDIDLEEDMDVMML